MNKILYWLAGYLPARIISDGETPYLERYYLWTIFGWRFYLHRFVGSDPDRGLHDHPWIRAFSIVLSGWYIEERRTGSRPVVWFNSLGADTFHRVVLPPCGPCWTLFFHRTGKAKEWGFLKRRGGVQVFEPYTYAREGRQTDWWLTAPSGRYVGRYPHG